MFSPTESTALLIDLMIVVGFGLMTLFCGWFLRGVFQLHLVSLTRAPAPTTHVPPTSNKHLAASPEDVELAKETSTPVVASSEADNARQALSELHGLTHAVAMNVDEHQNQVVSINEQIRLAQNGDPAAITALVAQLMDANERVQDELQSAETQLQEQAVQLEEHAVAARTDVLTGLLNRRGLDDLLIHQSDEFQTAGTPVSVMLTDLDHFKNFNDTYGHQAGDEVLRRVGRLLRECCGDRDIPARYGGEEFAVVFPGTSYRDAAVRANQVRDSIQDSIFEHDGTELRVTCSVGLSQIKPGEDIESLVKRSDDALYASKEAGRNCGHWHDGKVIHPFDIPRQTTSPVKLASPQSAPAAEISTRQTTFSTTATPPEAETKTPTLPPVGMSGINEIHVPTTPLLDRHTVARLDERTPTRPDVLFDEESLPAPALESAPRPDSAANLTDTGEAVIPGEPEHAMFTEPNLASAEPEVIASSSATVQTDNVDPMSVEIKETKMVDMEISTTQKDALQDPDVLAATVRLPEDTNSPPKPCNFPAVAPLPDLLGQKKFEETIQAQIDAAEITSENVSMVLVAMDVNDIDIDVEDIATWNTLMRAILQLVKTAVRSSDELGQFNGHTFSILMPATALAKSTQIAERLRRAISRCTLPIVEGGLRFTVSIGVSEARNMDQAANLTKRCDFALQASIESGGNCTAVHDGRRCRIMQKRKRATVTEAS